MRFNHSFITVILWTFLCGTLAGIWFLLGASQARGAEPPQLPDCRELLSSSYARQILKGDTPIGIHQLSTGVAKIDYVNRETEIYTEYFLISDDRKVDNLDQLDVYGPCMIPESIAGPAKPATMYVMRWLTRFGRDHLIRI